MKLGLLHISDLHKEPGAELTNPALLNSLERDRERYSSDEPLIVSPAIIIVSGDLIYGVSADHPKAQEELTRQYADAEKFLIGLCDSFVGGDRRRIILIPGNHDVSFYATMRSMRELTLKTGKAPGHTVVDQLFTLNSSLRWDWKSLSFYEITDASRYEARFASFGDFYEKFYEGK